MWISRVYTCTDAAFWFWLQVCIAYHECKLVWIRKVCVPIKTVIYGYLFSRMLRWWHLECAKLDQIGFFIFESIRSHRPIHEWLLCMYDCACMGWGVQIYRLYFVDARYKARTCMMTQTPIPLGQTVLFPSTTIMWCCLFAVHLWREPRLNCTVLITIHLRQL